MIIKFCTVISQYQIIPIIRKKLTGNLIRKQSPCEHSCFHHCEKSQASQVHYHLVLGIWYLASRLHYQLVQLQDFFARCQLDGCRGFQIDEGW